ncbi:DUF1801 domain-containing protein [Pedobacter sp. V48]|uniref:DUF1801 domain-containing protein n=1 Tax=Pedobacter sp. V48 TaxID=509635 RepID=UPI0003E54DFE|nr:DUF1801 domain-containing protein [Pedobacter sp. V48]ETZ24694.1 hypothetical protein N824_00290 [Pedobacter sp. V48]
MSQFNPKFDEYNAKSADFAKPIMEYLRQIIHETCPDVEEIIKWGIPHFDYHGDMMCIFAAYKNHCSFSIWKAALITNPKLKENIKPEQTMGNMDKIKSLSDLPDKETLIAYVTEAMALNENGIKIVKPKAEKPKVIQVPDYFSEILEGAPLVKAIFESKSPSFRKDYLVWIIDAKTDATRQTRIEQALEWIAEGKGRFWKYNK